MKLGMGYDLIQIIVDEGRASQVLKEARRLGATGGTILLAQGTYRKSWRDWLGFNTSQKELLWTVVPETISGSLMESLNNHFQMAKPNHGVMFSLPLSPRQSEGKKEEAMLNLVTVIVEKGQGEDVVGLARENGARGATIINGRGAGLHETSQFLNMIIEPEKEIVLFLLDQKKAEQLAHTLNEVLQLDQPGKGLLFVQEVSKAYGLNQADSAK